MGAKLVPSYNQICGSKDQVIIKFWCIVFLKNIPIHLLFLDNKPSK